MNDDERRADIERITSEHDPCITRTNGTAERCTCPFDCANYWLRASGYRAEQ